MYVNFFHSFSSQRQKEHCNCKTIEKIEKEKQILVDKKKRAAIKMEPIVRNMIFRTLQVRNGRHTDTRTRTHERTQRDAQATKIAY